MMLYLLKFTACLGALLIFYKLFLERESINVFKRFYLLGSLLFSLIVPLLVFREYITSPVGVQTNAAAGYSGDAINVSPALNADIMDVAPLLWAVYFLGALFFSIKFIRNLFQILKRINNNPKVRKSSIVWVLLGENLSPHTFFNWIFLNKLNFETGKIPKEVLLHEETHAKQKHSLDVLFIELLQIVMWFNPLIYFMRKSIKLNHEFLADKAVLKKGVASSTYQNTLLSFMTPIHHQSLANAINYSSIKKRFTVMKSKTSKKSFALRSLLLFPLLMLLLFSFSTTEKHYKTITHVYDQPGFITSRLKIEIRADLSLWVNDSPVALNTLSDKILEIVSPKALTASLLINASPDTEVPDWLINELHEELGKLGIKTVQINTNASEVNDYDDNREAIVVSHEKTQSGASKQELIVYGQLAAKYNAIPVAIRKIPIKELRTLEQLYKKMSPMQKAHAEAFPECPPQEIKAQEGASRKQMAEYNKLARHYNNMSSQKMKISLTDVERLRHIYSLMSEKQRADAEPFPDFPQMPPPPSPAAVPQLAVVAEAAPRATVAPSAEVAVSPTVAASAEKAVKATLATVPPSPPEPETAVTPENASIPPPPPPPKSPLEFAEEMAEKNAEFLYNGQQITSEKALEILKASENISIKSRHTNLKRPRVELSDKPFVLKED